MGKASVVEEQSLPSSDSNDLEQNVESKCCGFRLLNKVYKLIQIRCILVFILSVGLFLSALFWLPPFVHFSDRGDLDPDDLFKGHEIVARFYVNKPVSVLEDNILTLEDDLFYEIGAANTKVVILSMELLAGSNITKVVFGVDSDARNSKLSSTAQSLVRASFQYLVANQSLRLTKSLFGDPFSFEVLKFVGGITIIPQQRAFLLQRQLLPFNFTLNFSIHQLQDNFAELASQLRAGLRLTPYEILYIKLSNFKGSTVASPTTIESIVVLAVGNNPSVPRLKQLAQTIRGHSKNLGLNNTVFGKVKQVSLSSILQHSLHGGEGDSPAPSPSPLPHSHHHHHHHHHHHRHHRSNLVPAVSPEPAPRHLAPAPIHPSPAPHRSALPPHMHNAKPPGCHHGHKRSPSSNRGKQIHFVPTSAPNVSPASSPQPTSSKPDGRRAPVPHHQGVPASSPLPHVVFTNNQPPPKRESDEEHHRAKLPIPSPSSSSSLPTVRWAFPVTLALLLHM